MTPLPAFAEWHAPASWRCIDFVSDLHLSPATPNTARAFTAYLRETPADAVLILGDLFDAWVGDDARDGHCEEAYAQMLAAATPRVSIRFMAGNRDFLVGAEFLRDCGVAALADPTVLVAFGERVLLTHGDSLCVGDTAYQDFRCVVRSPKWQQAFLARPLAERRDEARRIRSRSEERKKEQGPVDIDPATAARWMDESETRILIHGHTHRPASETLAPGYVRHVLSDWDLDSAPMRAQVLRWERGRLHRVTPDPVGRAD